MALPSDVKANIARIEATRPDPERDPEGFRRANDEITRTIDHARQWQQGEKLGRKVV